MKILLNQKKIIICSGSDIIRGDFEGEKNLIKIVAENNVDFYYIGTLDRNSYEIIEVSSLPNDFKDFKYIYNNQFILNPDYIEPEINKNE